MPTRDPPEENFAHIPPPVAGGELGQSLAVDRQGRVREIDEEITRIRAAAEENKRTGNRCGRSGGGVVAERVLHKKDVA